MNKICAILPYYGEFPSFFNLFLYSVGRNKDFLDLLLVTDEPLDFSVPDNVKTLYLTKEELSRKVSVCIKEWFNKDVYPAFPETVGSRNGMYKLCDYKIFYQDLFKEVLVGYEYWGFIDADIVLGDMKSLLSDFTEYSVVGHKGHMCFIKNDEVYKKIMLDFSFWGIHHNYAKIAYKNECDRIENISESLILDERWVAGNINVFSSNNKEYKFLRLYEHNRPLMCDIYSPKIAKEYVDVLYVRDFDKEGGIVKNSPTQHFEYRDGKLFRVIPEKEETEHLYIHLIHRQTIIKNNISEVDFKTFLNFKITAEAFNLL